MVEGKLFNDRSWSRAWTSFLGSARTGMRVGLGTGTGSLAGFELAVEEEGGIRELFPREAEGGTKKDLGRPAPGEGHVRFGSRRISVSA